MMEHGRLTVRKRIYETITAYRYLEEWADPDADDILRQLAVTLRVEAEYLDGTEPSTPFPDSSATLRDRADLIERVADLYAVPAFLAVADSVVPHWLNGEMDDLADLLMLPDVPGKAYGFR